MTNVIFAGRDQSYEMRKEAIWAISNVVYHVKDKEMIEKFLEMDLMTLILERLQHDTDFGSISSMCLTTLGVLLERSDNAK